MTKKEKKLLIHLIKIWQAPFVSDEHKVRYYEDAENYILDNYGGWMDYIYHSENFDELLEMEN